MAEVEVRNLANEVVETLQLADEVFGYAASKTLVWEAVQAHLAGQRKGTHATKNRSLVRGGGRKPWRQKGTGRARAGTVRSPLWRSGGTVFGPSPRDYSQAFPKKKKRGALKMALSDKLKHQKITVIEELALKSHRTKDFAQLLATFGLDRKVLVVDEQDNRNLYLGSRNLPQVKTMVTRGLNAYDVLDCRHLVLSKRAVLKLQEMLQK